MAPRPRLDLSASILFDASAFVSPETKASGSPHSSDRSLEIGSLRSGHRIVAGDPVVRLFLRVGVRRWIDLWVHFVLAVSPRRVLICHRAVPCTTIHELFERVKRSSRPQVPALYGLGDSDPLAPFGYVVRELDRRRIGYLTALEPNEKDFKKGVEIEQVAKTFRPMTSRPFIANTGFDKAKGIDLLSSGDADALA